MRWIVHPDGPHKGVINLEHVTKITIEENRDRRSERCRELLYISNYKENPNSRELTPEEEEELQRCFRRGLVFHFANGEVVEWCYLEREAVNRIIDKLRGGEER